MTNTVLEPPAANHTQSISHETSAASHETSAAPPAEAQFERYDTIDTPKIVVVGFISAILTFVVIVAAQALFFIADDAEYVRKTIQTSDTTVDQVVTQQQARLADYRWVDAQAGTVSIPIEDAMRKVVSEEKAKRNVEDTDVR
jgi:hypothetical protein